MLTDHAIQSWAALAASLAALATAALAGPAFDAASRAGRAALAALAGARRAAASEVSPRRGPLGALLRLLRCGPLPLLGGALRRRVPEARWDSLTAALRRAGEPHDLRAEEWAALVLLGGAAGACAGLLVAVGLGTALAVPLSFLFGALLPVLWLRDRIRERHHEVQRALPFDLDLLTLSVEAGLDFSAALAKVVEKGRPGPLADELSLTLRELRLGKSREEALRNLSRRVGLQSLSSFVQALIQADRMGTSLGRVLRVLSTQMRIERTQRAEKLANEAPVKLLLPLIGCIFPTLFLMLFGPIVFELMHGAG